MPITQKTFDFLADLDANNDKDWFEDNRDRYETAWRVPGLHLIEAVAEDMARLDPPLKAEARLNGSLRRINRDTRFSKDKTPYNARLHLVFWHGSHPNRAPGMHVVLSPEGVGYGAGQWAIEPPRLATLRDRIASDPSELLAALDAAGKVGCRMSAPDLARLPKGYDADGPAADLLRYKGFVARTHDAPAPASAIIGAGATDWVMEQTRALLPLIRWLSA
ncbi:TIGR02453 family protein [Alphaproteobacteria bacterium GH1-50]|uniref:TIGR02453 family protein n=1 Tax=Kangsaoukella pontilimi TaxID=2691042 RepID=A0A7C9MEM7_9RHOB|nr:DUF2461 domain-containing protein [Kangsaoukella pontilimi]MXQ07156.1 TIGR02453 family protein [Kangsaoukella pontilimi]